MQGLLELNVLYDYIKTWGVLKWCYIWRADCLGVPLGLTDLCLVLFCWYNGTNFKAHLHGVLLIILGILEFLDNFLLFQVSLIYQLGGYCDLQWWDNLPQYPCFYLCCTVFDVFGTSCSMFRGAFVSVSHCSFSLLKEQLFLVSFLYSFIKTRGLY